MSKLKVDEIQSEGKDVKFSPKGTGLVEVKGAGGEDGTLQLNSSDGNNGVKIKSPAHSAGQSYTMILPDNNVQADTFLKVKSITGTGATAVGQLEYGTLSTPDTSQLNASNFTSGTIPNARVNTSALTAAKGFGLTLAQKQTVTVDNSIYEIFFTLEPSTVYVLLGKNIKISANEDIIIEFLNSTGNGYGSTMTKHSDNIYGQSGSVGQYNSSYTDLQTYKANTHGVKYGFLGEFSTKVGENFAFIEMLKFDASQHYIYSTEVFYGTDTNAQNVQYTSLRIHARTSNRYFQSGSEILLYKKEEA